MSRPIRADVAPAAEPPYTPWAQKTEAERQRLIAEGQVASRRLLDDRADQALLDELENIQAENDLDPEE